MHAFLCLRIPLSRRETVRKYAGELQLVLAIFKILMGFFRNKFSGLENPYFDPIFETKRNFVIFGHVFLFLASSSSITAVDGPSGTLVHKLIDFAEKSRRKRMKTRPGPSMAPLIPPIPRAAFPAVSCAFSFFFHFHFHSVIRSFSFFIFLISFSFIHFHPVQYVFPVNSIFFGFLWSLRF